METVDIERFRLSQSSYLSLLAMRHAAPWLWGALILVAAGIVAAFIWDVRALILAMLVAFILLPGLMALLYFNYGMLPVNALNTLPHSLRVSRDGIEVETLLPAKRSDDGEETGEEVRRVSIPMADVAGYTPDSDGILINMKNPKNAFLRIPYSALGSPGQLKSLLALLPPRS